MDSPDNIVHGREGSTIDQEFLNTNDGHSHEYMGAAPSGHHHVGSMNGQQDHPDSQNSGRNSAHIAPNQYIQQQSQQQQVQYAQDIIRRSFVQQQPYPQDPLRHSFIQQRPQSQAYPQDPLQQSVIQQPQQSLHGNGDSRASGYQRTSQMQVPRSPSLDYSEPPGSPLPPYVPRPPQPVKLPHYYQEIHHETQAPGQMEFMDPMDERRGYGGGSGGGDALWTPGNSRSHLQNEEEDIFQSAGQFNPEASRGRRKKKRDDDDDNRGECWTTLKDIAELSERWGKDFDPSFNQDLKDIYGYYVQRHGATVVVMESIEPEDEILACGILLPLPAEDVYDSWRAEPESTKASHEGLRLSRMIRLSVSKDQRGKGYGKKIVQYLIDAAREQRFDRILVETEKHWASAVGVYDAAGFIAVADDGERFHYEYNLQ
ncbi:hypothetical protein BGX28_003966 [Mortierella sp. GBA30]|nr:hypothetical protein BGX28_003966 [Mortierella sp. GBA30]